MTMSSFTRIRIAALVVVATAAVMPRYASAQEQEDEGFTNLQVYAEDITRDDLIGAMAGLHVRARRQMSALPLFGDGVLSRR